VTPLSGGKLELAETEAILIGVATAVVADSIAAHIIKWANPDISFL
jgi:hypothetical protein